MATIAAALARIKDDPRNLIGANVLESVCRELGLEWRDTPLSPPNALALFARQIAHGNVSCAQTVRLSGLDITPQAYCDARQRLPLEVIQTLSARVCDATARATGCDGRWRGHRAWLIDGSNASMPDTPALQNHFGQNGQQAAGCGFPIAHLLGLFDLHSGMLQCVIDSPLRTHDMKHAGQLHRDMAAGDLLLGDCAFATYAHLALLLQGNLHGLFPMHQRRIVDFTPGRAHTREGRHAVAGLPRSRWIKSLGSDDQLVEWFKPKSRPEWISKEEYAVMPESITVRELRRTLRLEDGRRITVNMVTTLLDPETYPADALTKLRQQRWEVETDLRHLKTTMKMEVLRCKSVEGVQKELAMYLLVYNLVRAVMLEAARRQRVKPNRLSFADTLYWVRHAGPRDELPKLKVNPHRPDRIEPRAVKRRPKSHKLLNQPRDQLRQALRCRALEV
jgi:hypothetical protein